MRSRLILLALMFGVLGTVAIHANDGKSADDEQRKSGYRAGMKRVSYPLPFIVVKQSPVTDAQWQSTTGINVRTQPAVSTGYYLVDSDDNAAPFWRPDPSQFVDTLEEPGTWRRIVSGPNQIPLSFWTDGSQNTYGGHAYFRNPGNMTDSTDDAFAGPIAIGFPFYFNGMRMDSFYVSTNGIIALTNRRYFYENDEYGYPARRISQEVRPGVNSVYDPNSDDPGGTFGGQNRTRVATGFDTTDATPDNFGYHFIACGGNPSSATTGIRNKVNSMLDQTNIQANSKWVVNTHPQLIAPFWDDLQLSVYNEEINAIDDFGRAYFKRSPSNDKLIIYYVNLTPIGGKSARVGNGPIQNVTFNRNNRPGSLDQHYRYSGQVILNRDDSSVVIQYERFHGSAPRNALQPYTATVWMRCNSTVGVTGGARRLVTFPVTTQRSDLGIDNPNMTRYTQYTEYLFDVDINTAMGGVRALSQREDDVTVPKQYLAIKFKQWKNVIRVINVFYRTRPLNNNATMDFTTVIPTAQANNYEILAGEPRLGAVQPIAVVQNLTNDIQGPQGVNFTRQGINFKVRFRIINEATGKIVYNTSKIITDQALRDTLISGVHRCDYDGNNVAYQPANTFVQPYEFIKVVFPAFEPSPFTIERIGRMLAQVIAEPVDSTNQAWGDQWPFDDTTQLRLFVMRRLVDFNDDVSEYHLVGGAAMPSVLKWVNIEADVVDGDEITNNPPPPRKTYQAANAPIFELKSPVIRMNRMTLGNTEIPRPNEYGGDELRSFPIDLVGRKSAVLSFSYQRTGYLSNWSRGFSDNRLIGPEHRVVARAVNQVQPFVRKPDELWLEFPTPSSDGLTNITNIQTWTLDIAKYGARYSQPYRVFGGGGHMRGYDIANKNRQLNNTATPPEGGMREDLNDDGKDWEFFKVTIPIPDTVIRWPNEGARNFRFRFKTMAINNAATAPAPADDEDNFFIDNVKILFPDEVTDVELSNITLVWPYTMAPASQATRVPIRVKVSNNTHVPAPAFSVVLFIAQEGNEESGKIYCRTITVPTLPGNREVTLSFPDANFRLTTPGNYRVIGKIFFPGNDLDPENDSTFTRFNMTFGPSFAYEVNPLQPTNDVPKPQFSGVTGKGLNHRGGAGGGTPSTWIYGYGAVGPFGGASRQYEPATMWGQAPNGISANESYGSDAGNASGQIAMRFTLYSQDTVYGMQAYWAELNSDILNISFSLYRDQGGLPGDERIANSTIIRRRGEDELDDSPDAFFGRYVTYLLDKPVILPPGEYWVSVAQRGTEGYELGASESRMGMVTTVYSDIPAYGLSNRSVLIDKNFRARSRGGALLNDNRFAFERTLFSGDWVQFTPTTGNPAYPHLDAMGGINPPGYIYYVNQGYATFTRGSWIPLLRPFFQNRSFNNPPVYLDPACPVPVELSMFDAKARLSGIDLFWETASEKNNAGFRVERREIKELTDLATGNTTLSCVDKTADGAVKWNEIGFVNGAGTTNSVQNYRYFDSEVRNHFNYEYRLRQVDFDGSEYYSNIVNVKFGSEGITLNDAIPNPSNGKTHITMNIPIRTNTRLEVFDMMGNLVRTLYNDVVSGSNGEYGVDWDGKDDTGFDVSSGSYIYRLTAGDIVQSKTIVIIR